MIHSPQGDHLSTRWIQSPGLELGCWDLLVFATDRLCDQVLLLFTHGPVSCTEKLILKHGPCMERGL